MSIYGLIFFLLTILWIILGIYAFWKKYNDGDTIEAIWYILFAIVVFIISGFFAVGYAGDTVRNHPEWLAPFRERAVGGI